MVNYVAKRKRAMKKKYIILVYCLFSYFGVSFATFEEIIFFPLTFYQMPQQRYRVNKQNSKGNFHEIFNI